MNVDEELIRAGLHELGLSGQDVAVHASLKSFGWVAGGAKTVVEALLNVCGTVLMPTFCEIGRTNPPADDHPPQNGWDYERYRISPTDLTPFNPATFNESPDLNVGEMGRIPAQFLLTDGTVRSQHPSVSWAANGPLAQWYIADHAATDPNLPLKRLKARHGVVLLLGVDLSACTAVHLAEELIGRRPFIRWVRYNDGLVHRVREYGCSDAFPRLAPYVEAHANRGQLSSCRAVAYPVEPLVKTLAEVITARPEITLCGQSPCRCQDALKGGPIDQIDCLAK